MSVTARGNGSTGDTSPHPPTSGVTATLRRRLRHDLANWRLFLVRWVTGGVAVVLTVGVLPGLRFTSWTGGEFLLIGLVFGLLNAVVKPIIQFFTLRYLVASYGIVIVLINAFLLLLLSWILGGEIAARGPVALLVGGAVVGALGLFLDTMAGTTPPIFDRPTSLSHADGESVAHSEPDRREAAS